MKIMHINCVYPTGSTGRITEEIHKALKLYNHESIVLYSRGEKGADDSSFRICGALSSKINHLIARITGLAYGGCRRETKKIIKLIKENKPDIVHLQCINGYFVNVYELIAFLKKMEIRTVITLHAEFMHTANCACTFGCDKWMTGCGECPDLYKATESYFRDRTAKSFEMMKASFKGFENRVIIVGVSKWLTNRAKQSPIMENCNFTTIYNGIDTEVFYPRDYRTSRNKWGFKDDEKIVLWVTSGYTEEKGKNDFLKLTSMIKDDNVRFVVVGSDGATEQNVNIDFLGRVNSKNDLAEIYSAADVMICCSKQESFPTVSLEAQCCGTPIIGYDVGGVEESIFPDMGEVVALNNIHELALTVKKWIAKGKSIEESSVSKVLNAYTSRRMVNEYYELYEKMLGECDEFKL